MSAKNYSWMSYKFPSCKQTNLEDLPLLPVAMLVNADWQEVTILAVPMTTEYKWKREYNINQSFRMYEHATQNPQTTGATLATQDNPRKHLT